MHGTWVDDLSETSQKEKLGNVCIYYVDFFPLNVFHYSETRKLSSHFPMLKLYLFKNQASASQFLPGSKGHI